MEEGRSSKKGKEALQHLLQVGDYLLLTETQNDSHGTSHLGTEKNRYLSPQTTGLSPTKQS